MQGIPVREGDPQLYPVQPHTVAPMALPSTLPMGACGVAQPLGCC